MSTENMTYRADPADHASAANWADDYRRDFSRAVGDKPGGAVAIAFGAGFGVGLAIGISLVAASHRRVPRSRAEEIGHRILESLHDYVPESLAKRMS